MSWKVRSVWTWVSTRILMVPPSFPSENPSWNPLSMLCWWILPMLIFFTWHLESVFGCDKLYWDRTKHLRAVDSPSLFLPTSFLFFSSVLLVIWCFSKKKGRNSRTWPDSKSVSPQFFHRFPKKILAHQGNPSSITLEPGQQVTKILAPGTWLKPMVFPWENQGTTPEMHGGCHGFDGWENHRTLVRNWMDKN